MLAQSVLAAATLLILLLPVGANAEPAPILAPLGNDLAAIQETLGLPRATIYNDRDGDKIFDDLETRFLSAPLSPLSVVVTFRDGADTQTLLTKAKSKAGGFEPTFVYPKLFGFAAILRLDQVERIATLEAVRQIEWDTPGELELDTATVNFGARAAQQHLLVTGDLDGKPESFSNKDVVVAVLDTGFDGTHVDLAGKFLAFVDAKDKSIKDPYDTGSHGTHVASIVGGLGKGEAKYAGVAPGAALVGIQITGAAPYGGATGSKAGALFGVDWILQNQQAYNIRISTISFGFGTTRDGTDALELAFDRAFAAGVLPFKSNGNSGPEKFTTTIPGGARGIVAVGSMLDPGRAEGAVEPPVPSPVTTDDYGFHLSGYSSRGPTADNRVKPDIAAPGQSIMAASNGTKNRYVAFSGTSMASPFAAGSAALVMAADPKLNVSQVRDILFQTAEDWGAPGADIDYGHGRLDTLRAVQMARLTHLQRAGAEYAELEAVTKVAGPDLPYHAFGVLNGNYASKSLTIRDAKKPVAVTFLLNATLPNPVNNQILRAWVVEIRAPNDAVIGRLALPGVARQQLITFVPPVAGTYSVTTYNGGMNAQVVFDVSAGLPPPPIPDVLPLPEPESYTEKARAIRALQQGAGKDPSTVPGLELMALLGAAAFALFVRRRF